MALKEKCSKLAGLGGFVKLFRSIEVTLLSPCTSWFRECLKHPKARCALLEFISERRS